MKGVTEKLERDVLVRMTGADYRELAKRAKKGHRSLPGEIRFAIERHLKQAA